MNTAQKIVVGVVFGFPGRRSHETDRLCEIASPFAVRDEVVRLGLLRSDRFDALTDAEWAAVWNGWGPDSWPEALRSVVTWVYRQLEPVAAPHDEWYDRSDGKRETWERVTNEWAANTSKVLNDRFPLGKVWMWPERSAMWAKAALATWALRTWSFSTWQSAAEAVPASQ